jgi:hypothetical protein
MYIFLNRSHPFWSYKGSFVYITYPLHAHYMNHLLHLHWTIYINITESSKTKLHYTIFCVLLLNPTIGQIFPWLLFFLKVPQNMLFLQWKKSQCIQIKWKNAWFFDGLNIPLQVVLQMQSVTKWRYIFLKTVQNTFSKVKCLFHKDRLIHGQTILDTAYMKCAQH